MSYYQYRFILHDDSLFAAGDCRADAASPAGDPAVCAEDRVTKQQEDLELPSGEKETEEEPAAVLPEEPAGEPSQDLFAEESGAKPLKESAAKPQEEPVAEGTEQSPDEADAAAPVDPEEPEEPVLPTDIDQETLRVSGIADKTYTGKEVKQTESKLVVALDGKTLTAGTDYTVSYENNINAGEAYIIISGQGDYTGSVRIAFAISPKDLTKASVSGISTRSYTGKALTQTPTVKLGTRKLVAGTDYKLSYKNNKAVGKATLTITGKGNYKGTINKTFEITDKAAKKITVSTLKCSFKVKAYVNYRLPLAARPVNVYLTARKGGVMQLKWTDCKKYGAAIDGYIILRKTKPGGTYTQIKQVSAKTVTYIDKTPKKNNQMYYYAVVGYKKNSNGTYTVSPARNAGGVTYESKSKNPYSVKLNYTKLLLYKGQTKTLKLNYSKYKKVCSTWTRWYSSDTAVVTVDSIGKLKAVGTGNATIYVRTANGRKVTCNITVKSKPAYKRVADLAKKEVGYEATGSGSYGNRFSKYAKELDKMGDIHNGPKYGYDWCDIFADWCYIKVLGKEKAVKALNQPKYGCGAGCYFSAGYYRSMGRFSKTPSVGAQVFYDWDGDTKEDHTGIVVGYDATYVYTVEGNVGGGHGKVDTRTYKRTSKYITGYGKPKW